MKRLNLGCGTDLREGYVNVDFREPCDEKWDITQSPWPVEDDSIDEILMFDIFEHVSYLCADSVLFQTWRVLKPEGYVDIQVPDFEHCSYAALDTGAYLCNSCGASSNRFSFVKGKRSCCECGQSVYDIGRAAIQRLYGGQDYEGNFHFNAFTKELLVEQLKRVGFGDFEFLEKHHMWLNWSIKIRAHKTGDIW